MQVTSRLMTQVGILTLACVLGCSEAVSPRLGAATVAAFDQQCSQIVCPTGQSCVNGVCVAGDPCSQVVCPTGQMCVGGQCVVGDPCAQVVCPAGQVCVAG